MGHPNACSVRRNSRNIAPDRSLFVSRGLLRLVFARGASTPWRAGFEGRSVGVGFGSDLSEVPVFRDLPAALDSESPLIVLPDPVLLRRWCRRGVAGRPRR
jgi:hypothetical protein